MRTDILREVTDMIRYADKSATSQEKEKLVDLIIEKVSKGKSRSQALTDTLSDFGYIPF